MLELFLNPANMVAGGVLISSPIIIHLINRMRYRRVRWAAMEFLLKSQKRNRRRLIIEQLILLLLRILLVLMAGLLLARFLGFAFGGILQPKNTTHVVVLDDRLSMADHWKAEDGEAWDAYRVGRQLLEKELGRVVAQARSPQRLVLFRLSDPDNRLDLRLNEDTLHQVADELAAHEQPTKRHLDLARGVRAAEEVFTQSAQDTRYLHVVSDFRALHWAEPDATELLKELENLRRAEVRINLVDTAHPARGEGRKDALYHDNLAVVELRPETRVAAEGMPVQFTVTVANHSPSERKNVRVTVKVDGAERPEGSLTMQNVPPGLTSATFLVSFVRLGHAEVTANLEDEEAGLRADNTRYATVEVRRQVPVLVVDGDLSGGDKPGGDTYHVRAVLTSARGYEIVRGSPSELERPTIDQYPSIYLLNVRELSDKALKNLENYAAGGGSVAFFLGDRVNPDFYNRRLYAGGKGLFPAPLAERPTPALSEEEQRERTTQNLTDPRMQLFVRNDKHPIFAEVGGFKDLFMWVNIDRYFPVPRAKWNPDPARVEELATLPNNRPVTDYQASAQEVLDALPADDPACEKYRAALEYHRRAIRDTLTGKSLHALAGALDALLRDPPERREAKEGERKEGEVVSLKEFWEQTDPKVQNLKARVEKLRETVQYGDPLVIASRFGRGRVVTFLTTAGKAWNDWAGGSGASVIYPVVMLDMQKFLTGGDPDADLSVGDALGLQLDSTRYEPRMHCYYRQGVRDNQPAAAPAQPAAAGQPAGKDPALKDLGEVLGTVNGPQLAFSFDKALEPGIYQVELLPRPDAGVEPKPEARAFAVNVDTRNESDLRRAGRDELERFGRLHVAGVDQFPVERQTDLSESAWFYIVFLLILIAEQALAVHLSFHLKGNEAQLPAAARPQTAAA